jgi:hypothetical protein
MSSMDTPNGPSELLPWQTGDMVLDAENDMYQRATDHDIAQGWPWANVDGAITAQPGEGGLEESYPKRPLRLMARGGQLVNGCPVVQTEAPAEEDEDDQAQATVDEPEAGDEDDLNGPVFLRAPSWYFDGSLSLTRNRMKQAHAILQRVTDESPIGFVQSEQLDTARAEAWAAELAFARQMVEIESMGRFSEFIAGDVVIDATCQMYVRASPKDAKKGITWQWWPNTGDDRVTKSWGSFEEEHPERPLRLVMRDGRAIGGFRIYES